MGKLEEVLLYKNWFHQLDKVFFLRDQPFMKPFLHSISHESRLEMVTQGKAQK